MFTFNATEYKGVTLPPVSFWSLNYHYKLQKAQNVSTEIKKYISSLSISRGKPLSVILWFQKI